MERITLTTPALKDYALLDSGEGEKLERYGAWILARPDPQALWQKEHGKDLWDKAHGRYVRTGNTGTWQTSTDFPSAWNITIDSLRFLIRPTSFKHTGLFPEQLSNWQWSREVIKKTSNPVSVLNLFGYTGAATLAAAQAGAQVVHLDASKTAVQWARENAVLSELQEKPIRWIVEDTLTFVRRELKRGHTYDAIIMDPPAFGHGPDDELWKIEEDFIALIELSKQLLSPDPLFFLINGYAAGYSSLAFAYNLSFLKRGILEHGDLTIQQEESARMLPCGIFARWKRD